MKKIFLFCFCALIMSCNSQSKKPIVGETEYQKKENARFKDASTSPLKKKDLKKFKGLEFFPVDSSYVVTAKLARIKDAPAFEMKTTTDRRPMYKEYAKLHFSLQGKECELTLYQSIENMNGGIYKDYLFLPFTDDTSGIESYGGGRYMNVFLSKISADDTVVLNFNNTYNPYCAYNDKYSCPITPRKNHLDLEVKAGVKAFKK